MNADHPEPRESCRHLLQGLSDYIDGEAEAALCAEIESHLARCENCRVVVDTLRRTVLLYHAEPAEPLPAGVRLRLLKALDLDKFANP